MDTITFIINTSGIICSFIICIMLIIGTILGSDLKQKSSRWFLIFLLFSFVGMICEASIGLLALSSAYGKALDILIRVLECISFSVWGIQLYALIRYAYEYIYTKKIISKVPLYIAAIFMVLNIVLAIVDQFNHMYGMADSGNLYQSHDLYWVSILFPILLTTIFAVLVLQHIKVLKVREWVSFLLYLLFFDVSYMISWKFPDIWIEYLFDTIPAFLIYINVQVEMKHQMKEQEVQLAENRIAVMVSQIQPHFLYNALTVIQDLCVNNPPEAEKAVGEFASYLRCNLDSLTQKYLIPFKKELDHVENYLSLEKKRFGDRLTVQYDFKTIEFMLPALTLQLIVENAVCHGITKKEEGGTIHISTVETPNGFQIIVADDGVGFDVQKHKEDGRSHVGIDNARRRLTTMCDGVLELQSTIGIGTTAIIIIPKGGNQFMR